MINKSCPLTDKEKLKTILHGICCQTDNNLFTRFNHCEKCSYFKFPLFAIPIIRRAWPKLIAQDIFQVQPMASPVGSIFKFRKKRKRK